MCRVWRMNGEDWMIIIQQLFVLLLLNNSATTEKPNFLFSERKNCETMNPHAFYSHSIFFFVYSPISFHTCSFWFSFPTITGNLTPSSIIFFHSFFRFVSSIASLHWREWSIRTARVVIRQFCEFWSISTSIDCILELFDLWMFILIEFCWSCRGCGKKSFKP